MTRADNSGHTTVHSALGPLSTAATPLELLVDNLPQSQSMTGPVLGHRNTKWPSKCDILHDEKLVSQA